MSSYKKVALLGKGVLGSAVLEQLVDNDFTVTLLSREPSNVKDLPSGVEVTKVDYSSKASIVEALRGHDVVINTLGAASNGNQEFIIDASIDAGVKRYIPNDWSHLSNDPLAKDLPTNYSHLKIQAYLKQKADEGLLEYTIINAGPFFDLVLKFPYLVDTKNRSVALYDNGETPLSTTSTRSVGKAVVGALKVPEATKNKQLAINDTVLTQAKVYAWAKKYTPTDVQWTETRVDAQEELEKAVQALKENPSDHKLILPVFKASALNSKLTTAYPKVDNELLGLPLMTEEEVEAKFAATFQKA
ncbi:hypothetical protein FSARC_13405 [Fusarium sarcochroum]|uniref:NAD(P)-binding domain-containing protein n=1 Tax=Fusarium sarcochroum TaxID=1208366 RepID=A0A8H4WT34_9HYPO|nr:hypothetical protein FSARC_13405 [Fusarium sarcochroum]